MQVMTSATRCLLICTVSDVAERYAFLLFQIASIARPAPPLLTFCILKFVLHRYALEGAAAIREQCSQLKSGSMKEAMACLPLTLQALETLWRRLLTVQ